GRNAIMNCYERMHLLRLSDYDTELHKIVSNPLSNSKEQGKVSEFWCKVYKEDQAYIVFFTDDEDRNMKLKPGFTVKKFVGEGEPGIMSIALSGEENSPWKEIANTNQLAREITAVAMYKEAKALNKDINAIPDMLMYFPPEPIETF
ncbi:MAG TPA: hypothetical protein VHA12_01930, partial [Candidatus Nanoarchaeia archaeon]|nr:hypothetical protein [Candidatus Nanoarchaeia archaeon]